MKRCTVTVEGTSIEVEAASLYGAAFQYNYRASGSPASGLPHLEKETPIEVRVEGNPAVHRTTMAKAMRWANYRMAFPGK